MLIDIIMDGMNPTFTIITCVFLAFKNKKSYYIPFTILILSITIFIKSNILE